MGYTKLSFADFVPTPDGAGYVPINGFPSTLKLPQHASALYDYLRSQKELVEPVSASELYRDIFQVDYKRKESTRKGSTVVFTFGEAYQRTKRGKRERSIAHIYSLTVAKSCYRLLIESQTLRFTQMVLHT